MFTLQCTGRLLRRLGVKPGVANVAAPTTRLGNWHANLIHVGRQQFVLAASDKTFLPVLVTAAPNSTLVVRLAGLVGDVLTAIGIPKTVAAAEVAEMSSVAIAKTNNKQVLGVLVELAGMLPFFLDDGASLQEVSLKLADAPCGPLRATAVSPDRATLELFGVAVPPRAPMRSFRG